MATRPTWNPVSGDPSDAPAAPLRGSVLWRYYGDVRSGLLGPHILLMQVAHPVVGAGVKDHSDYRNAPWQRLVRTGVSISTVVYGGPGGAALESARLARLHRGMKGVDSRGRRYSALNPEAYAWVHATLVKGALDAHALFGRPLTKDESERFYEEGRGVGRLLGLRDADMPPDLASFTAYYDAMVAGRLEDNAAVRDLIDSLRTPAKPPLRVVPEALWRPFGRIVGSLALLVMAGATPPPLRERLGLEWTPRDRRRLRHFARLVRFLAALVIPPLRIAPALCMAYWNVNRRARLDEPPDR